MKSDFGEYTVEVNEIGRGDWARALASFEDANINQCWGYGAAKWGPEHTEHVVLKKNGVVLSMAQVARLKFPFLRTGIAYVTWGPVWKRSHIENNEVSYRTMLEALKDEYVSRRRYLLRIKPYGFEEDDQQMRALIERAGFWPTKGMLKGTKRTILISLSPTQDELRRRLNKKWRNSLTNSEKEGLQIKEEFTELPFHRIEPIYNALLREKNIISWNLDELKLIQSQLEDHEKMRITTCESGGEVIAASICSAMGDTVIGLVGVTSDEGRKKRAYYLLQWDEIIWAKTIGKGRYDLSGINPLHNPTVYHFKAGLNGAEMTFLSVYDYGRSKRLGRLINFLENTLGSSTIRRLSESLRGQRRHFKNEAVTR